MGGGTKNPVWLKATSDIAGLRQVISERTIGASFGDAFLAAVATGHAVPADIAAWNPSARTVEPRRDAVYERHDRIYRVFYDRGRPVF